ncbi:hypothetical protein RND81_08G097300 [Saponaria officinalis]|uniref:Uncharacterized protein n=1 Tax=Saponaria officinalis TaxID=3572 RepID=A0AAW1J5P0_SAPOF
MGRSPCCDKLGLKKGPWTPEEDQKLLAYIQQHGHGNWRALPSNAGLQRCGKSCRLRWTNYLRPDIKRGRFSLQEEQTIIQLHALLGNRWSAIATHLPKRTDNEIKNYWNTHLKKRLTKMGIDPVTHKPKNDALVPVADGGPQQSKTVANLSHIAQWESARLEAEARLVRQSKLRSNTSFLSSSATHRPLPGYLGNARGVIEFMRNNNNNNNSNNNESLNHNNIDYNLDCHEGIIKEEGEQPGWSLLSFNDKNEAVEHVPENRGFIEGFTELLLSTTTTTAATAANARTTTSSSSGKHLEEEQVGYNNSGSSGTTTTSVSGSDYYEDNKNYWNSILNLVNSSPPHSPMF